MMNEKDNNIFRVLSKYLDILEDKGYNVVYIGLHGSQNYNLDDELSDIDCKAIIIPSLHDIIFRKSISTTIETKNGNIDVKDLLTFYDVVRKGNFSFIEAMNTNYWCGYTNIREMFKKYKPNIKSMLGAMCEKKKALTHEYPSKVEEFKKFGCDVKQYHHIMRLYDLILYNINDSKSFIKYEDNDVRRQELIKAKRSLNGKTLEEIDKHSEELIEDAKKIVNINFKEKYEPIEASDEIFSYIEEHIKEEINNG